MEPCDWDHSSSCSPYGHGWSRRRSGEAVAITIEYAAIVRFAGAIGLAIGFHIIHFLPVKLRFARQGHLTQETMFRSSSPKLSFCWVDPIFKRMSADRRF